MLRWVIVLLVLANGGFYAWSNGHLGGLGLAPADQREPERLQSQIRPETMRLVNAPQTALSSAAALSTPAAAPEPAAPAVAEAALPPTACWLAKGFSAAQAGPLEKRLLDLALPKGSWRLDEVSTGGRWVVYMGRYSEELLGRKKDELRALNVEFRTINDAPLGLGLALGTYSSGEAAEQGLKDAVRKGVRSARVAREREPSASFTLRLAEITEEERSAVEGLGAQMLDGKTFQPCD